MVQGGMSCIKYLMFVFNFVFVVAGIALIIVGAIVQTTGREYTAFLESKYVTAPTILIAVGVLIFLLAFLGCCGAVKENHCMVTTFGILLFIIFVIEMAGAITAYVYRDQFETFLKDNMNSTLMQQKDDMKVLWAETQTKLKCCGVNGPEDYKDIYNGTGRLPESCCKPPLSTGQECTDKISYQEGCFKALEAKLKGLITMVGGVGIGIAVIELLGVIFAWCLASAIKKEYEGV